MLTTGGKFAFFLHEDTGTNCRQFDSLPRKQNIFSRTADQHGWVATGTHIAWLEVSVSLQFAHQHRTEYKIPDMDMQNWYSYVK